MKKTIIKKIMKGLKDACANDDLTTGWWDDLTLAEKKKAYKLMEKEDFISYDHWCKKHKRGWYSIKKHSRIKP